MRYKLMGILGVFLIAIGLSMDAFSVAICKGLGSRKRGYRKALLIALYFGGFQMLMPIIGWLLGTQFESYIKRFDHWVAFLLLIFIGGKMIYESFAPNSNTERVCCEEKLSMKELLVLSLATSIDALAAGLSFALLGVEIIKASVIIGITTFILAFLGVMIGCSFGIKFKQKAEIFGGAVLVLLGIKILLEHTGVISL